MQARDFARRNPDEVLNQSLPLENYNPFESDRALRAALQRYNAGWADDQAHQFAFRLGQAKTLQLGELANHNLPILHTHDRAGNRLDEVEYHPAYHELMRLGIAEGCHAIPWRSPRPGAHVARGVLHMLRHQVDEGSSCPITMTFAVIPSLRLQPEIAAEWEPLVLSNEYDPRFLPPYAKRGALFGMAMTERQGGSDVQSNSTRAQPLGLGGPGTEYSLTGHKWFCSAPMCDAFLTLAQAPGGLSCFLLPRWKPDGTRNAFHIQRLKDKSGNRSNASSEIELHGAWARLVSVEGRGVHTIIEMVRHTRLDCAMASAASLRRALAEALHHTSQRFAFGRHLVDQPLMQNVLADMCLESEAATLLALRLAHAFDEAPRDEIQAAYARIVTAIAKYWITKRAPIVVAEALECLGGNGYVETTPLARLYRDILVNAIWEGSGNIQCLDVLRALQKDPATLTSILQEIRLTLGVDPRYDAFVHHLETGILASTKQEVHARRLVEALALGLQGALIMQFSPPALADAFCMARLAGDQGLLLGTLPTSSDFIAILQHAWPGLA